MNAGNAFSEDIRPADYPREDAPDGITIPYRRVPWEDDKSSRFRLRRFIEAIGGDLGRSVNHKSWVGQMAMAHLSIDTYDGIARNQIDKVTSID